MPTIETEYAKFANNLKNAQSTLGACIDTQVTGDIHRIFRMPGSLNSKSGLEDVVANLTHTRMRASFCKNNMSFRTFWIDLPIHGTPRSVFTEKFLCYTTMPSWIIRGWKFFSIYHRTSYTIYLGIALFCKHVVCCLVNMYMKSLVT